MTGGQQPVGGLALDELVALLEAEGVRRIVVTSDDPGATRRRVGRSVAVRHRDELLRVQAELAAVQGVTVLIHDQECAAEKRRKRRRGTANTPVTRCYPRADQRAGL
jgi:indolepyruvate ferredoxin oxidoreductase